jgi:phosphatidate cytidylyltransferase
VTDAAPAPTGDTRPDSETPIHPRPPTPAPPKAEAKSSELPLRLLTAAVLIPSVVYVVYMGGLWYLGTVIAIILLGQREIYGLIEDKGAHPLIGFGLVAGAALPVVAYIGTDYHATVLMTATLLTVMVLQLGKAQITEALASISGTFFGVFYVGWLMSHAVGLREFHDAAVSHSGAFAVSELGIVPDTGIFFVVLVLAIVILSDAGAYFAGRAYGRRKLAPKISPAKTVEGALGGLLGGTLGALGAKGVFDFFWPQLSQVLPWGVTLALGIVVALVAIAGDLIESLLKRDAQVKDAGKLLPGMGGVLDRIDSFLLGIPVMYYLLLFYVFLRVG